MINFTNFLPPSGGNPFLSPGEFLTDYFGEFYLGLDIDTRGMQIDALLNTLRHIASLLTSFSECDR